MSRNLAWTAALALALGCSAPEGAAQEERAPASRPAAGDEETARYAAEVRERGDEAFTLGDASLFVPEVSLFGGSGGEETRLLELKRGAAKIEVPFARIERVEVGKERLDRLEVTVHLRPAPGEDEPPAPLAGTVRSSLELRGTYAGTGMSAVVRLRDIAEVALRPAD